MNRMAEERYTTIFHPGDKGVTIHREGTVTISTSKPPVLQGCKSYTEKLWTLSVSKDKKRERRSANVYSLPSIPQSIRYPHAAARFPVEATWIKAFKSGNFITWPGLTKTTVIKHFPESDETVKGHMKKQRQEVRSTKAKKDEPEEGIPDLGTYTDEPPNHTIQINSHAPKPKRMNGMYIKIPNASKTMHSNFTGRFPAISSRGSQYKMVFVEVDGNYVDAELMKNMTEGSIIKTYLILWAQLTASGTVKPTSHLLDNEASAAFKVEIKKNCKYQLVPPDNHRMNLAQRAIQTFKNHFKAVIAGVDKTFPMQLWDRLLTKTVLTLNLLQQSNVAPTVSAYQYVNGAFDYNKMPLAPMQCAVQIHE